MKQNRLCLLLLVVISLNIAILPRRYVNAFDRQNPLVTLGFNRCQEAPCFLKIIPGTTSWTNATTILLRQNFDWIDGSLSNIDSTGDGIVVFRVPDNPQVVNWIE